MGDSQSKVSGYHHTEKEWLQATTFKRVCIKKKNGKLRPLGIPTMKDRAMQALYLMALEPVAETTADLNSYGFRKARCTNDVQQKCHIALSRGNSAEWILEGDIKGCFDHISHEWLLNNIPMDKSMLRKWLKADSSSTENYSRQKKVLRKGA